MMYASKEGGGGRIPDSYLMQQPLNSPQRHHHAGPHSGTTPLGGMTPSLPEAPWGCASIPRACSFILCIGPLLVLPCVLSHFSHVRLFAILWTVARQAPLSMGFSRQEYWRGLPCPPPGDHPDPGIELSSYVSCIGRWVLCH